MKTEYLLLGILLLVIGGGIAFLGYTTIREYQTFLGQLARGLIWFASCLLMVCEFTRKAIVKMEGGDGCVGEEGERVFCRFYYWACCWQFDVWFAFSAADE